MEERRTVNGPDKDGLTEAAFEISLGLPPRYMYKDGEEYEEPAAVYNAVMQQAVTNWNDKNPDDPLNYPPLAE